MVKQQTILLNLKKSEGLCWIDENPFLVINLMLRFNSYQFDMRIKKHVVTNELLFDFTTDYQKLEAKLKLALDNQEQVFYEFHNQMRKIASTIIDTMLAANVNCWNDYKINLEYEI